MTDDQTPKDPPSHRDKIRAALNERSTGIAERASNRIALRDAAGRSVAKLSNDDWSDVLDRIANGEIPSSVMRSFGVKPHALNANEKVDLEFSKRLSQAYSTAYFNFMVDGREVARGNEGYSSGNIERDKLIIDTDWKMAKALVPRLVDKQQIDQRTIVINVVKDDAEW